MKRALLIMAVLLFASAGRTGEVLRWVDERGVVHFTDDGTSVPKEYREQIERRELPDEREAASGSAPQSKAAMEEERDRHGRGEGYWAKRAKEIKDELDRAHQEYERVRLEYNDLVAQYNATRSRAKKRQYQERIESLQEELNRRREDVDRVKELLEKALPEEAERAGASAEWVK